MSRQFQIFKVGPLSAILQLTYKRYLIEVSAN